MTRPRVVLVLLVVLQVAVWGNAVYAVRRAVGAGTRSGASGASSSW